MTTFTPPVGEGYPWADADDDDTDPHDRLFRFYGAIPTGETVWKDEAGVWHQGQYPTWGDEVSTVHDWDGSTESDPSSGLGTAQKVYQGSHTYDITLADALDLIANGFGDGINISDVNGTWTTEQLSKFDTRYLLTADGSHATGQPFVSDNNALKLQMATGTTQGQSQLREFILHSDTSGWIDTHGIIEIDPPLYQADVDGDPSLDIIPQMGVVLRAQFNSSTGKNQGITLNNGTFLALPILNIGAWHAFPDGTGFQNRQFSWPLFEGLPLPYGWEYILEGNIIRVRQFRKGESPDTTPWDHPTLSRTLNLDTDCGSTATVPTPTGAGTNGIISAHLGLDSRSATRIRRFFMERLQ